MKTTVKKMDYEAVMALPRPEHKLPVKTNLFWRTLIRILSFFAMIGTMVPATTFSGLIDPVSSLEGFGRVIGELYPATYMVNISRGVFNKALGLGELSGAYWAMLASVPVIMGLAVLMLKKQER